MDPRRRKSTGDQLESGESLLQSLFERRPSAPGLPVSDLKVEMFRPDHRQPQPISPVQQCLAAVMRSSSTSSQQVPDCELAARRVPGSPDSVHESVGKGAQYGHVSTALQAWTPNYASNDYSASQTGGFQQATVDCPRGFGQRSDQNPGFFCQNQQMASWSTDASGSGSHFPAGFSHVQQSQVQPSRGSDNHPNVTLSSLSRFAPQNQLAVCSPAQSSSGWLSKHPCAWNPVDCQQWLRSVADDHGISPDRSNIHEFRGFNGPQLMQMGEVDFILKDKDHGALWFARLHLILGKASVENNFIPKIEPVDSYAYGNSSVPFLSSAHTTSSTAPDLSEYLHWDFTKDEFDDIDVNVDSGMAFPSSGVQEYPTPAGPYHPVHYVTQNYTINNFCSASSASDGLDYKSGTDLESDTDRSCNTSAYSNSEFAGGRTMYNFDSFSQGRSSSSSADSTPPRTVRTRSGVKPEKSKSRSKHGTRGNHLWEFIRDLLKDRQFSPKIVKWENREDGVFRFVESEAVAKMWGEKKCNPRMTYEKLSRAMRTYYGTQILLPVPKTGRYPKKLVYMFGPKATGWNE